MPDLLVKPSPPDDDKCIVHITPESAGWNYVGFAVHQMLAGDAFERRFTGRETCIVVVSGFATIIAGDAVFDGVGNRTDVFAECPPAAVYVPPGMDMRVVTDTGAEVALCTAPSGGGYPARLIDPETIEVLERGSGTNRRIVRNILPETEDADSLLIAEVITPGGHWSSYPPHKHDTDNVPEESSLEETYYHRLNPRQGFVLQRVYTDDRGIDETMAAYDGDVVMVPRGYHPVGAPHGYDSYYLNVMAGPRRTWIINNDPDHEWIVGA
ncbi:MAG: 5-deoxy-glucuronate isomerase [Xanthomonadales bacterium]|nr:5-deoxy-glucuronate isomerase [Xanthomonadales bacterium]